MEIEILNSTNSKPIGKINVSTNGTIEDVKIQIAKLKTSLIFDRQSIRLEAKGKSLKDSDTLQSVNVRTNGKLYVKDLGPQIGWKTVFLAEYAGPLFTYLLFYQRPWIFYGDALEPISETAHIAAACWTLHYAKRLLETVFVHRFSHSTMPVRNLFKNCAYYWLFAGYVAYHVNHPKFTSPCMCQVYIGLAAFLLFELGNFAIHLNLRNLRPPGTKVRKIPQPDWNPLTQLYNFVSCPNYTYEFSAWFAFSAMTQCIPAFLFAIAGMYQMTVWAIGKHKNYKKEFKDYPKQRKAVIPFIL
jgi:very-long-chain enoyl-CoA reductase